MGARRELDDKLYIYLNFINTLLELKNVKNLVKDDKAEIQKAIQDVKVPAIKKELVSCKETIGEVIRINNLLVDEFALRWNYILIEGAFRSWLKELSFNNTKIDIMLFDYVRNCFIESDGKNITIDWSASFKLKITRLQRQKTSRTEMMLRQEVSDKNGADNTEYNIFFNCIDEILNNDGGVCNGEEKVRFKERIIDLAENCSLITKTENLIYEIKRGIEIQQKIWISRCNDTIELEKHLGITKDLKRKKKKKDDDSGAERDEYVDSEKLENKKTNKELKSYKKYNE
ncbi:hypothetical protein C1646_762849 [Rhizophagus diaphanus]|nr:hypothetical protein C1646_762849 [Rhizophagus diaphanus] [Rhizophagus sp. MUCL 43196]